MTGESQPLKETTRQDLAGTWRLSFDDGADWKTAELHLPGTTVSGMTPNPPSGGWDGLKQGTVVTVPCTTDEVRPGFHGVSWWSRTVEIEGAREVRLQFLAARLMVEVYWDRELIGYDLEGYTPFAVIVPEHLKTPGPHQLDVRITNPGGSDNWEDLKPIEWAGKKLPSSHDFGGIWQTVYLEQTFGARIDDLWVRADVGLGAALIDVTCDCLSDGVLHLTLRDPGGASVGSAQLPVEAGHHTVTTQLAVANPSLYDIGQPNLYRVNARLIASDAADEKTQPFGFRRFDLVDDRIELNGREIYLRTAISWSLYASGPVASRQELRDEIQAIEDFGQNALTAHRRCANPDLVDALEERGLLLYQEPGGLPSLRDGMGMGDWMADDDLDFAMALAKERVRRLVKRDRSRACLVWWNLANECLDPFDGDPGPPAHALLDVLREGDDSRVTTWTSAWNPTPMYRPFRKEMMRAFDFHGVLNWPSMWHPAVEQEVAAFRPPEPMVAMAGESQNFCSIAGVMEMGAMHAGTPLEGSLGALAGTWADRLDTQLAQIDPAGKLGGPETFCGSTARVQGHGVARLILHHRANPDVNGLAINGWHSHHRIGTMGITRMDRKPCFDTAVLAAANAPIQIVAKGISPTLTEGEDQSFELFLIDDENRVAADTSLNFTVSLRGDNGTDETSEVIRTVTASRRNRLKYLQSHAFGSLPAGNYELEIVGRFEGHALRFAEDFMVVKAPDLNGFPLTLYDPVGDMTPFFRKHGAELTGWRLYQAGRPFVCVSNLRILHTLFCTDIKKAVCMLRSTTPRSDSLRAVSDLKKIVQGEMRIAPLKVLGHWNGGWAFSLDDTVLPSLGTPHVWDWKRAGVFPQDMIVNLKGRILSGACSFDGGGAFETGDLTMGATAAIVEANGTEVLVTTLPLIEAIPTDPLASRLIEEMAVWLNA